jgi:glycosyltransferase involved in cell wall biosynthesis
VIGNWLRSPFLQAGESFNRFALEYVVLTEKASLAVLMLSFNEAIHLPRCLDHIQGFAQQIFLVDSGSTDGTVEIASGRGVHVLQHPFQNYARQFQWGLENAPITADWVMRLDPDEIIEPDLAEEIVRELPRLPTSVTGVILNRKTIFQGKFLRHGGRYPLFLLRIWRRGMAQIEDRWMDEHMLLTEGGSVTFRGGFADHNLNDLTFFTEKHNQYASREALDVLNQRMRLFAASPDVRSTSTATQAKWKRFLKESVYNRIPFEVSATLYFLLRYVIQLGFLDGRPGLTYHVLQGFWYRFLVGAKLRELEQAAARAQTPEQLRADLSRLTRRNLD